MSNKTAILLLLTSLFIWPHFAYATTNYIYPLPTWEVTTHHGEEIGSSYYHMGVDAGGDLPAGSPVYAVADGVVKEAQVRSQFGLVVLIEHVPEGEDKNVSLYGHLRPSDVRVTVGQVIHAGDIVGVLGSRNENGGWGVHLHFGIYKGEYSPVWVYYGHVHDPNTAQQWEDPEAYIPVHLFSDTWLPVVTWQLGQNQLVGDTVAAPLVGDIGAGLKQVKYFASTNSAPAWQEITLSSNGYSNTVSLKDIADGPVTLKTKARDLFGNKTVNTITVNKNSALLNTPIGVIVRPKNATMMINEVSFGNGVLNTFAPLVSKKPKYNSLALIQQADATNVVIGRGSEKKPAAIKILTLQGQVLQKFRAFDLGGVAVASGDVDQDGVADIVVGSRSSAVATVKAFHTDGTLLWETQPYGDAVADTDVAVGDVNNDGLAEVIVAARTTVAVLNGLTGELVTQFKPFGVEYIGGINVTTGNIVGDAAAEIIVATRGSKLAEVRIFDSTGIEIATVFNPFENYSGAVDVSITTWEEAPTKQALLVSQASAGDNWLKLYSFDAAGSTTLVTSMLLTNSYNDGMLIDGWK